mmetsp:Transcript_13126/g.21759  ORF Transcript_13126/g.21759 Transcript_13126/m.21759 type:complete len:806 (+) Transcript_13126:126-2543(+)
MLELISTTSRNNLGNLKARFLCSSIFAIFFLFFVGAASAQTTTTTSPPQLNGQHFRITVLEEKAFLDVAIDEEDGSASFSGYLIDMLEAIARPDRANFKYTLLTPSGYGSACNPRLQFNSSSISNSTDQDAYGARYRTQYNCGASDVNDLVTNNNSAFSTDMYLGMYYVTPSRQLENQFTIPFNPPYSGTLSMYGTAIGIPNFEALVEQQAAGTQPAACTLEGTALIQFVKDSYPGIQIKPVVGGEKEITQYMQDGTCEIYIFDGPLASSFVLRRFQQDECLANDGKPIGTIGAPMGFGLSHYAIGVQHDISIDTVNTLSYWMNILMLCNPLDPHGSCPEGNLATFYEGRGGTGAECGYILFPESGGLSGAAIGGIVFGIVFVVVCILSAYFCYKHKRQERRFQKRQRASMAQTARERELNEFLAHEIRNPMASAIAALSFVSSKVNDAAVIPNKKNRDFVMSDVQIVDSSLQFVNELLRNMLDIHGTANKSVKLAYLPTDVLRDVFEPVASILFMRGNPKVKILTECPPNLIVMGDRMRLKQIILNLSSNSTKFVQEGYIRLRAEVANDKILLHVEDSGPGIPPDKRNRLFAKFQESLDSLNQGTGIGLCVCKNLSDLMKADIYLDEHFDSGIPGFPGTRFTLRLNEAPLVIENGVNGMEESDDGINAPLELAESLSVLFVDDDLIIRKMFTRSIARAAPTWNIKEASNGETALRLVEDNSYDIIFIDQYMASIEKQLLGTETVRLMRAKGVNCIICGLSANDKETEFLEAGANGFMMKPFPAKKEPLKAELLLLLDQESSSPV